MVTKVEPAYIGQALFEHPVELDRNLLEGLFQRTGAIRLGDYALSVGAGTRAIAVAPGRYHILGVENAQQGGYFAWSDAIETFLLSSVATSRIDSFILRVHDDQYGTIPGVPTAFVEVVQGIVSGSPVARADSYFNVGGAAYVPGAWARLGDVRVNAADTGSIPVGQITTANRYIRMPGGMTICGSTSRPTDPLLGDKIFETDTKLEYWWDGVWRMIPKIIQETVLGSSVASVTLSGIPSTIKTLRLHWMARSDAAAGGYDMNMRINSVSTGSYFGLFQTLNNATTGGTNEFGVTEARIGVLPGNVTQAYKYATGNVQFDGWNRSAGGLHFIGQGGFYDSAANSWLEHSAYMFDPAGPYNALRFHPGSGNFVAGTTFTLEAVA